MQRLYTALFVRLLGMRTGRYRMASKSIIPVLYCVDVEPDLRDFHINKPSPWAGFEYLDDYLKKLRGRFEEATAADVHFCWYLFGLWRKCCDSEEWGMKGDQLLKQKKHTE